MIVGRGADTYEYARVTGLYELAETTWAVPHDNHIHLGAWIVALLLKACSGHPGATFYLFKRTLSIVYGLEFLAFVVGLFRSPAVAWSKELTGKYLVHGATWWI